MKALVELAQAISEGSEQIQDVSELVQAAMEQCKEEALDAAKSDIVTLVRKISAHKVTAVAEIRKLKVAMKKLTSALDDLDRRWAYSQATNNFLPVLAFFNEVNPSDLANPDDFNKLTSVPSDFTTKENLK